MRVLSPANAGTTATPLAFVDRMLHAPSSVVIITRAPATGSRVRARATRTIRFADATAPEMGIAEQDEQSDPVISFEFFPPKPDAGYRSRFDKETENADGSCRRYS